MVLFCFMTDDFRWKVTETLEQHDQSEVIFGLLSLPLTCRPQASICSAAFLCCWTCTKDSRPWQETRRCCTIPQVWKHLLNQHKSWEQISSKFFTAYFIDFFAFFSPACSSFSSYCLSPSHTAHGKRGREDSSVCFLELSVVQGHLDWCHVKFRFRLGSKQWVRSAGTFIYYTLITFTFWHPACSAKKNLISSRSQQKENTGPFLTLELYLLSWLTPVGLLNQDQGLALKTMDSDADGSYRNMEESWQMRMF